MDKINRAKEMQGEFAKRYPLIDWRVGWDGPSILMIRASLSINDPMTDEFHTFRTVQFDDITVWDTATVDMYGMTMHCIMKNMVQAILEWKRE